MFSHFIVTRGEGEGGKCEATAEARPEKAQRKHRAVEERMKVTPESMETTPMELSPDLQPNPHNIHSDNIISVVVVV